MRRLQNSTFLCQKSENWGVLMEFWRAVVKWENGARKESRGQQKLLPRPVLPFHHRGHQKTPIFGLLAKEGVVLQSRTCAPFSDLSFKRGRLRNSSENILKFFLSQNRCGVSPPHRGDFCIMYLRRKHSEFHFCRVKVSLGGGRGVGGLPCGHSGSSTQFIKTTSTPKSLHRHILTHEIYQRNART